MKVIIGIVLLCTVVCTDAALGRIHNGFLANIETYPWTVNLRASNNVQCGGSIISPNFVLSSAHCGHSTTPITIIFGTHNLSEPLFTRTVTHENIYINPQENQSPAATLLLARVDDIPIGLTVQPIRLPKYSEIGVKQWTGYIAYLPGFGSTWPPINIAASDPNVLLWLAYTEIIAESACTENFEPDTFTSNSICGQGYRRLNSGGCIGDEGAPLSIIEDDGAPTQIGIFVRSQAGCISPSVFTSIEHDLDWIYDTSDVPFRY